MKNKAELLDLIPVFLRSVSNQILFGVLEFDGHLDINQLNKALTQIYNYFPLTRSRLDWRHSKPIWQTSSNQFYVPTTRIIANVDAEDINQMLSQLSHKHLGVALRTWVIQGSNRDTLCIAVDHALTDASGAKNICYLLARTYSDNITSAINTVGIYPDGGRSQEVVADKFGPLQKLKCLLLCRLGCNGWQFPIPSPSTPIEPAYLVCSTPVGSLPKLKQYGRSLNATINDLLLAAFYNAAVDEFCRSPNSCLSIRFSVDLRRYLKASDRIDVANLSGTSSICLKTASSRNFSETVAEVRRRTDAIKRSNPGLDTLIGLELLFGLGYRNAKRIFSGIITSGEKSGTAMPMLTNLGRLNDELLAFRGVVLRNAYILGPSLLISGFTLSASSFRSNLTLSVGYNRSTISDTLVKRVVSKTIRQMHHAARAQKAKN